MNIFQGLYLPLILFDEKQVIKNKKYETGEIGAKMSPSDLCITKKIPKEACKQLSEKNKEPCNQLAREWDESQITVR